MPSQNSSTQPASKARFSAPELVSTAFIDQVLRDWDGYVQSAVHCSWQVLAAKSDWRYQAALCCLFEAVLENLGVERPLNTAFALIDHSTRAVEFECELVLIWSGATHLDEGDVLDDCTVTRVTDFPLPPKRQFLNTEKVRRITVARWATIFSATADDLPQKEM